MCDTVQLADRGGSRGTMQNGPAGFAPLATSTLPVFVLGTARYYRTTSVVYGLLSDLLAGGDVSVAQKNAEVVFINRSQRY